MITWRRSCGKRTVIASFKFWRRTVFATIAEGELSQSGRLRNRHILYCLHPWRKPRQHRESHTGIDELLLVLLKNLRRAMHPLTHRRKAAAPLTFSSEYDIQDLLHALLRPWVLDIRPEEFTPSYAGSSTRMDFLLPAHKTVIEMKLVRDAAHAKRIGDELIIDIDHYRKHPGCEILWCVVYDPEHSIRSPESLKDLEGSRTSKDGTVEVKVLVV
jgi:hypothetical protein